MPNAITHRPNTHLLSPLAGIALLATLSCTTSNPDGKMIHRGGQELWLGPITQSQLHRRFPEFAHNKKKYNADSSVVSEIESELNGEEFILFLGTWCADSTNEVPKFLAIYEDLEAPRPTLTMHAVDRAKRDHTGSAEDHAIDFAPTLIVNRNGHEIGRIVELPERTMEENLLRILNESTTR